MQTFVQVARAGSFTAVASRLGLSRAVISRHVSELEEHLGVPLVRRSTRAVVLTDAGRQYLEVCDGIFDELATQEARLSEQQKEPRGTLNVIAPKSFGSMQLSDAIVEFSGRHPTIGVRLILDDFSLRSYEFINKGLDVAIRGMSDIPDTAIVSRKLCELSWVACAAPSYLKRHGEPKHPADLARHNCLVHLSLDDGERAWRFKGPAAEVSVKADGDFMSNNALVLRKAVLAGRGIGCLPLYCTHKDLASGALKRVLINHRIPKRSLYLLYPQKRMLPLRTRLFINFLRDWFKDFGEPNG